MPKGDGLAKPGEKLEVNSLFLSTYSHLRNES